MSEKTPYDFIDSIVSAIRISENITGITDNGNGTYNIYTSDTSELSIGDWLSISGTTNFNTDNAQIIEVQPDFFVIKLATGITIIDFGTWTKNSPYYDYASINNESNYLTLKNPSKIYRNQKLPLFLLVTPISQNKKDKTIRVNNTVVYIFEHHSPTKSPREEDMNINEYPALRNLEKLFIKKLQMNIQNSYHFEYNTIETFYLEGYNFFNTPIVSIRMEFDIEFDKRKMC